MARKSLIVLGLVGAAAVAAGALAARRRRAEEQAEVVMAVVPAAADGRLDDAMTEELSEIVEREPIGTI